MILEEDLEFTRKDGSVRKLSDIIQENKDTVSNAYYSGLTTVTDFSPGSINYGFLMIYSMLQWNQEFQNTQNDSDFLLKDAAGDALDDLGRQKGVYRNEATFATTDVIFTLPSALSSPFTVLSGTELSTQDSVLFVVDEDVTFNVGDTTVVASVVCEESGTIGNVLKGEINTIITSINQDLIVTNLYGVANGTDEESDDDYRERILDSWLNYQTGTHEWFEKIAETVVTSAKYYKIDNKHGELVYKPTNDENDDFDVITLKNLFSLKQYSLVDHDLNFQKANFVNVIDNSMTLTVILKDGFSWDIVSAEIINNVTEYVNNLALGSLFRSKCVQFLGESVPGVDGFVINGVIDVSLSNSEYAVISDLNLVKG